ncbi:hypothetical protein JWG39_10450 [Desulforhopalus vacuolatus]|uniref:hypothetical protein n=1 Tax=Desulforhopalus vacuolatus TaxID=40414 RepID=UPI001965065E|nr:hypothetical protein [Desulforhopalus vacuolatus]MBM9520233.1 hypothetical protein [Desulforhopalus vacuolatus]
MQQKILINGALVEGKGNVEHIVRPENGEKIAKIRMLMNRPLVIVELILSFFLEKNTRESSKNSSLNSKKTERFSLKDDSSFSTLSVGCFGVIYANT